MRTAAVLNLESFNFVIDLKLTPVNSITLVQAKNILAGFDELISTKSCPNEYAWKYIIYYYYKTMHQQYGVDSYTFISILANNRAVDINIDSLLNTIDLPNTSSYKIIKDYITAIDTDGLGLSLFYKSVIDLWSYKILDDIKGTELWYLINIPAYSFPTRDLYNVYLDAKKVVLNYMAHKLRYV